jgi:hypothetical protein
VRTIVPLSTRAAFAEGTRFPATTSKAACAAGVDAEAS